jgi:hypothetical protein
MSNDRFTARFGSTTRLSNVCGRPFITASTPAELSNVTKPKPRDRPSRSRNIMASLFKTKTHCSMQDVASCASYPPTEQYRIVSNTREKYSRRFDTIDFR